MLSISEILRNIQSSGHECVVRFMAFEKIFKFYRDHMSYGDRLSEFFYGFAMVAIVTGMISNFLPYGPEWMDQLRNLILIIVTIGVGISWGLIDGLTSLYGGLTDKADEDRLIAKLKTDRNNPKMREDLLSSLDGSSLENMSDEEKQKVIDKIIDSAPEKEPKYPTTKDDWKGVLAIMSCDVLPVIPVILPFLIWGVGSDLALSLSRGAVGLAMGYIGYCYAKHTGRRPWLTAIVIATITLSIMIWSYNVGW
jgi:hypothetical protein